MNSELIDSIYSLVVVDVESGIDIIVDNCLLDVKYNYRLNCRGIEFKIMRETMADRGTIADLSVH